MMYFFYKALIAFWNYILDGIFAILYSLVNIITAFMPTWAMPTLNPASDFFSYASWVAYYVPMTYGLTLLIVYLGLLVNVKIIRGVLSIVQVDV